MIEYRTSDGNRIEVAANGHVSTPKIVDLRSLGCPSWLADKVEARRAAAPARTSAPASPPFATVGSDLEEVVTKFRKAAQLMGKDFLSLRGMTSATKDASGIYSYDSLRQHMQTAAELAEASYAIATTVDDLLGQWPGTDGDGAFEDDSLRSRTAGDRKRHKEMHDMHKNVHRMLGEVCQLMAHTQLTIGQIMD